jgi:hypothetical protein
MTPNIELAKTRDFGEIISDSFSFIRENFKQLLSSFFIFCGIFLLVGVVSSTILQLKISDVLNNFTDGSTNGSGLRSAAYGIDTFISAVVGVAGSIAIVVTIISFMALYKQKGNIAPTNEELWGYIKYYFFKILGVSILNYILLIIALILCVFPGIYLSPILGLIIPIIIVENASFGYAWDQSFRLIKENWWKVFGSLFITWIILLICASVLTLPFQAVNVWSIFLHKIPNLHLSVFSIIMGAILQEISRVFYILPVVALGICYFSLTEAKDATGLMSRIDQLGKTDADTNTPAEEY